jgi:hypothetical protein
MVVGSAALMFAASLATRPPGAVTLRRYFPDSRPLTGDGA